MNKNLQIYIYGRRDVVAIVAEDNVEFGVETPLV